MTSRTVYGVSSGEFSDYSVGDLFTNADVAEAYAAAHNEVGGGSYGDEFRVEEFVLRDIDEIPEPRTLWQHHLCFSPAGYSFPGDVCDDKPHRPQSRGVYG